VCMFRFRSLIARLPLRVLVVWFVAGMVGWLAVALVGLAVEREVYAVPLTAAQVITVVGGMEGLALVLAVMIFALLMLAVGRDTTASPLRVEPRQFSAAKSALTPSRERAIAAAPARWHATVLQ
ncbi:MAG: hypothetical protein ACRENQ_00485, partial [Gemmatimonadaceae bacterium]